MLLYYLYYDIEITFWSHNVVVNAMFWRCVKYSPIMENQMLLPDMEKERWLITYRQNRVKMAWAFINIMNAIHHLGCYIMVNERTTSCYIFYPTNQMLCMIGVKLDGYIHGWGTQKEYFTPKSLSKHYFEWPLHLWFFFFIRWSHTFGLKCWWFFGIWIL